MRPATVRVLPDAQAVYQAAAEEVVRRAAEAVGARGVFALGLAGGATPRGLYHALATEARRRIFWARVHFFWSDERCVPPDDPGSNYRMARETLFDHVPVDDGAIHRIRGELGPADAAADYDARLADLFGRATPIDGEGLDLAILGVGGDGHTASLFPGQVDADDPRWAVAHQAPPGVEPRDRVTLTLRALNASHRALFLATGAEKREVVARVWEASAGPPPSDGVPPAALVRPPGGSLWLVDREAAGD